MKQQTGSRKLIAWMNRETLRRGWVQRDVADRSGLPSGTVSRIFRGLTTPTVDSLEQLARAFDLTLTEFLLLAAPNTTLDDFDRHQIAAVWADLSAEDQQLVLDIARTLVTRRK